MHLSSCLSAVMASRRHFVYNDTPDLKKFVVARRVHFPKETSGNDFVFFLGKLSVSEGM